MGTSPCDILPPNPHSNHEKSDKPKLGDNLLPLVAQLVKNPPGLDPWVGKIPWRRERLPTPVFWPGEFHGLYSQSVHGVTKSQTRLSDLHVLSAKYLTSTYQNVKFGGTLLYLFLYLFIHSFLAMLRLHCWTWAFCRCRVADYSLAGLLPAEQRIYVLQLQ